MLTKLSQQMNDYGMPSWLQNRWLILFMLVTLFACMSLTIASAQRDDRPIEIVVDLDDITLSGVENTNCTIDQTIPTLDVPAQHPTIQDAINASVSGDVIRVANGTYIENIDYLGKEITIASDFAWTGNQADIDNTIIDGNQNGSVVKMINGESIYAQMIGLTIRNGNGTLVDDTGYWGSSYPALRGGGFYLLESQPMLCDLRVKENRAQLGGGIYSLRAQPTISGTIIIRNDAVVQDSLGGGGGIYFENSGESYILNTVIAKNSSEYGGGIYNDFSTRLKLDHVTIADNTASIRGGGILRANAATITMRYSIVWGNSPTSLDWRGGTVAQSSITESDVQTTGDLYITYNGGNITLNPLFVNAGGGDYHLTSSSPAIDMTSSGFTVDLDHSPRDGNPDMGAYCCEDETITYTAGIQDNFAPSTDPASPSPALVNSINYSPLGNFDETGVDKFFAHTIVLPNHVDEPRTICKAQLEIRLKPLTSSLSTNDTVGLGFGSNGSSWGRYLGDNNGSASLGLLSNTWMQQNYGPTLFTWDLAALPLPGGGSSNLLNTLETLRFLDVMVQDDTAVDYIKLTVTYCCDPVWDDVPADVSPITLYRPEGQFFELVSPYEPHDIVFMFENRSEEDVIASYEAVANLAAEQDGSIELTNGSGEVMIPANGTADITIQATLWQDDRVEGDIVMMVKTDDGQQFDLIVPIQTTTYMEQRER